MNQTLVNQTPASAAEFPKVFEIRMRGRPWSPSPAVLSVFLIAAVYLVLPAFDVPYWGLSLSAPLFALIAADITLQRPGLPWTDYRIWVLFAAAIWAGQFLSMAGNIAAGEIGELSAADVILLIRYAYWMAVFLLTTVIVSRARVGFRLARLLGSGVIALGCLRLAEGLLYHSWGSGQTVFFQQNVYGLSFSTFTPFALAAALTASGARRIFACGGLALLIMAVIANGSRGSWVVVPVGLCLTAVWMVSSRKDLRSAVLPGLALLAVAIVSAGLSLPATAWDRAEERWASFGNLERDKSLAVRRLMVQKGLTLFAENPLLGIGPGRFRQSYVMLDIPEHLRHQPLDRYNRRSSHNAYVGTLAETGLAGTTPLALLLLYLLVSGAGSAWAHGRRGEWWAIAVYAGFLSMCAHLWVLSGLTNTATWFVLGLVAGLIQSEQRVRLSGRFGLFQEFQPAALWPKVPPGGDPQRAARHRFPNTSNSLGG